MQGTELYCTKRRSLLGSLLANEPECKTLSLDKSQRTSETSAPRLMLSLQVSFCGEKSRRTQPQRPVLEPWRAVPVLRQSIVQINPPVRPWTPLQDNDAALTARTGEERHSTLSLFRPLIST